jgi:phosphatidylglycerophosphate synthase/choline kinase
VIEALTKLVNVIGNINPGNIGTFEGGNMLIGKLLGLNGAAGLALAVSRRLRSLFWAGVGAIWLLFLTKSKKRRDSDSREISPVAGQNAQSTQADSEGRRRAVDEVAFVIFLGNEGIASTQIRCSDTRVGALPILLRTILGAQKAGAKRIMVVVDPMARRTVQRNLLWTRRLPACVEWIEANSEAPIAQTLLSAAAQANGNRLVLVDGNTTYHPSLLKKAVEWNGRGGSLAVTSGEESIGIHALSVETLRDCAERFSTQVTTLHEFHVCLRDMHSVICVPVDAGLWQRVDNSEDRVAAEQKLDSWLVKPTDGIYARLNRRISIPISRQLIKFPITANMVSIFTLSVGFASAAFFALGGYWNTLLGALLCWWASVLDGCDGEVARLKLLESDFGCWLETICDYAFYLALFVGMTIGMWRSSGSETYLMLGGLLLAGAIASFLAAGWQRNRLAAGRPEQLLKIWQAHAESRRTNPFLYFGRQTEFIVRRCFFPYALLVFALFNIMNVAFIIAAIGANLVWSIALYSSRRFAAAPPSAVTSPAASA